MTQTQARPAQDDTGPQCPFCRAPWTRAMLDQYDAMTDPHGCACCGPAEAPDHAHAHAHRPVTPPADIACAACGRAIYRAM